MIGPCGSAMCFRISGPPVAQPRVRATIRAGHAGVYTPKRADGWKSSVVASVLGRPRWAGPVFIRLEFVFERPKSHFGKKGVLPSAPEFHQGKPDVDNLAKSTLDAMVDAGFLVDDKIVAGLIVTKEWGEIPGCLVTISSSKSLKEGMN